MVTVSITKRAVDAVEPGRRDLFLWDAALAGFGLKVTPSGSRVYLVQYRTGGRGSPTRRVTIGRHGPLTPDQARREAKRILGEVAGGRDPADQRRARRQAVKTSVRAVAEDWLQRDQAKNRTVGEVRRIMERDVLPAWGNRPIGGITKRDVIELLDGIVDRGSVVMANRTLAYVRHLLNWAAGRDVVQANVAQFVPRPTRERTRDRVLEDGELLEIWRACDEVGFPFGTGIKLLILTAARRDEIFSLSWPEVDLETEVIRLPASRSKTAVGRTVPLCPQALAIVHALPRFSEGDFALSFTGRMGYSNFGLAKLRLDQRILKARQRVAPDAEPLAPWRLHDLRRTLATGLQRLGIRLEVIEAALGHVGGSRAGIVGVYQRHRFEAEVRAALEAWGRHVEALVAGGTGNVVAMTARR